MIINKNPKVDLKRKYASRFEMGFIFSLSVVILMFLYFPRFENSQKIIEVPQELVAVEDVALTKQDVAPPPPPKPIIPIETPAEDILEDIAIEQTELNVEDVVTSAPPPQYEEKVEEVQPTFFIAVEEMPEPIGGIAGIQSKIIYPEIAKRAGVQGKVYIKAYVDEEGIVKKAEVIKGIGAGCDEAAIQAVMQTRFKPGRQRGKAVKVQVSIPIRFVLQASV